MEKFTAFSIFIASLFYGFIQNSEGEVFLKDEPRILNDNIAMQWGGHTFSYLLTGENAIFWSATDYNPDDLTPTALIGQEPKLHRAIPSVISKIRFYGSNVKGNNQPQMVRTKDGYIHAFIGVTYATDNPNYNYGRIHYYRSDKPENITNLIDRTELIPKQPYEDYHLRMNVGISPDGQKVALVILSISEDGKVSFNTPVIFIGEKKGLDFVFKEPLQYAEPMGFFYPQVAFTDDGIVLIAEIWDKKDWYQTRLIHLDMQGKEIHREDIPINKEGYYFSYDMRPLNQNDWGELIIYYNVNPIDHQDCRHEFWKYNTKEKKLEKLNSIKTEYGMSNAGKWIPIDSDYSIFINNPSMGQLNAWEGNILDGEDAKRSPIPKTNPIESGFKGSAYIFTPNVLQGSIISNDEIYLASDFINQDKPNTCSFILCILGIKN